MLTAYDDADAPQAVEAFRDEGGSKGGQVWTAGPLREVAACCGAQREYKGIMTNMPPEQWTNMRWVYIMPRGRSEFELAAVAAAVAVERGAVAVAVAVVVVVAAERLQSSVRPAVEQR